jgi:hypothetical protein
VLIGQANFRDKHLNKRLGLILALLGEHSQIHAVFEEDIGECLLILIRCKSIDFG